MLIGGQVVRVPSALIFAVVLVKVIFPSWAMRYNANDLVRVTVDDLQGILIKHNVINTKLGGTHRTRNKRRHNRQQDEKGGDLDTFWTLHDIKHRRIYEHACNQ